MAKMTWIITLDGCEHTIELEHKQLSGKRHIRVDGALHEEGKVVFDIGSTHEIPIDGHTCTILIRTNGLTYNYDLLVDGVSEKTGQEVAIDEPMPGWLLWLIVIGISPMAFSPAI